MNMFRFFFYKIKVLKLWFDIDEDWDRKFLLNFFFIDLNKKLYKNRFEKKNFFFYILNV